MRRKDEQRPLDDGFDDGELEEWEDYEDEWEDDEDDELEDWLDGAWRDSGVRRHRGRPDGRGQLEDVDRE